MKHIPLALFLALGALAALPACSKELTEEKKVTTGTLPGDRLHVPPLQVFSGASDTPAPFDFEKTPGVRVLVVNSTKCPYCQKGKYGAKMAEIEAQYAPKGVTFVYLYPDSRETIGEKRAHHDDLGLKAPWVADGGGAATKAIDGSRTPEYVVVNAAGVITYRGGIDDSHGNWKDAHAQFLAPALDATLEGRPVTVPQTEPVG